jgi:hypothetical protein
MFFADKIGDFAAVDISHIVQLDDCQFHWLIPPYSFGLNVKKPPTG